MHTIIHEWVKEKKIMKERWKGLVEMSIVISKQMINEGWFKRIELLKKYTVNICKCSAGFNFQNVNECKVVNKTICWLHAL
jgi:hypothetical protein